MSRVSGCMGAEESIKQACRQTENKDVCVYNIYNVYIFAEMIQHLNIEIY